LEYAFAIAVCLCALAAVYRFGPAVTLAAAALAALLITAFASARAFAIAVLLLAPLPSLGALVGRDFPLGLEPLDLLIFAGLGIAFLFRTRIVQPRGSLLAIIAVNVALLLAAFLRTYGIEGLDGVDVALVVKPILLIVAGFLVVSLVPREQLMETIAFGMVAVLFVTELSIVLQRIGVYETVYQADNLDALSIKQFGGIMLHGNVAGAFLAIFAVPTYLIAKESGHPTLGLVALAGACPALLVTLNRGSMVGVLVALLVFAALTQRRVRAIGLVLVVVLVAIGFALTLGDQEAQLLVENYQQAGADQNAQLSGRESIWDAVFAFLEAEPHRWWVGGGLASFGGFAETTLGTGFATHNGILYALANGGILMLIAFAALGLESVRRRPGVPDSVTLALRVAAVTILVVALTSDTIPYSPTLAWIWVLLAVAERLSAEPQLAPSPLVRRDPTPGVS